MAEIVLVGQEWPERALLAAELEELGHQVTGFENLSDASVALRVGVLSPQLLVLDTLGLKLTEQSLADLHAATNSIPTLVIAGPFDAAKLDFPALGFSNILVRPVFIRQVTARAEELLTHHLA